jgi:hypothetical protein
VDSKVSCKRTSYHLTSGPKVTRYILSSCYLQCSFIMCMTLACPAGVALALAPLPREAALAALREDVTGAQEVAGRHFLASRLAAAPALLSTDMLE